MNLKKYVAFTVVCMNNNEDVFNSWLLSSLKCQRNVSFELKAIKTVEDGMPKYDSAFKALSALNVDECKGEYLLFCHNDVRFYSSSSLNEIHQIISKIDFDIIGFAGKKVDNEKKYVQYSSVLFGPKKDELIYVGNHSFHGVVDVQTLDECCFIIPRKKFKGFKNIGVTWDLYCVQYCLDLFKTHKSPKIFVIETPIWHKSMGKIRRKYYLGLYGLSKYYRKTTPIIYTTCGIYNIASAKNRLCWRIGISGNFLVALSQIFHFFFPNFHPFHKNK